jgi:hypothetical protein
MDLDCGNQFSYQSKPAVDGYKGCNYPCSGNATGMFLRGGINLDTDFAIELCGGQDHLDMYGYNNTVSNPLLTTSSSSTVSSTTTSLSSQSTAVVTTSQTSSTSLSWSYVGCWTDAVGSRTLANQMTGNANIMTTEFCISECASRGLHVSRS